MQQLTYADRKATAVHEGKCWLTEDLETPTPEKKDKPVSPDPKKAQPKAKKKSSKSKS